MHKNSIEILLIFTFVFSHQKRETPLLKSPLYTSLYKIVKLVFVLLIVIRFYKLQVSRFRYTYRTC